jgi:hypothetical protein
VIARRPAREHAGSAGCLMRFRRQTKPHGAARQAAEYTRPKGHIGRQTDRSTQPRGSSLCRSVVPTIGRHVATGAGVCDDPFDPIKHTRCDRGAGRPGNGDTQVMAYRPVMKRKRCPLAKREGLAPGHYYGVNRVRATRRALTP